MTNVFVFLIFFAVFFAIVGSIVIWTVKNGISPMPTSRKVGRLLLEAIPADLSGGVYDLGSGWGTLALSLAKRLPHCSVVGIESSPIPFWASKGLAWGQANLFFRREDFFTVPLDGAALVVCYLYPGAMRRLKEKFERELRGGTWVISHTFAIPGWTPWRVAEVSDLYKTRIYIYRSPTMTEKN